MGWIWKSKNSFFVAWMLRIFLIWNKWSNILEVFCIKQSHVWTRSRKYILPNLFPCVVLGPCVQCYILAWKYRNWRYEWTALIRTDHVYCIIVLARVEQNWRCICEFVNGMVNVEVNTSEPVSGRPWVIRSRHFAVPHNKMMKTRENSKTLMLKDSSVRSFWT